MKEMFAPLYKAAAMMGIPAATLDRSPPHVVAWMLEAETEGEQPEDLVALAVERARGRP